MVRFKAKRILIWAVAAFIAVASFNGLRISAGAAENVAQVGGASYSTLESALTAWTEGKTLKLLSNAATATLTVSESKTLDLNGYTLEGSGKGSVLRVEGANTSFALVDSSAAGGGKVTGGSAEKGGGVFVSAARFEMSGGVITGNSAALNGGGVYLEKGAQFVMTGGALQNNKADFGAGLFVQDSTATVGTGALLSGNEARFNGGGAYVMGLNGSATLTLAGKVTENSAKVNGGGVSLWTNGTLVTEASAEISANTATRAGGGVYLHGVPEEQRYATVRFVGGTVTGNTAQEGGGIALNVGGILLMNGGSVSGNEANRGGGIAAKAESSLTFGGSATVKDNTNSAESADNVFLDDDDLVRIENGFTGELGFNMSDEGVISKDYNGPTDGLTADGSGSGVRVTEDGLKIVSVVPVSIKATAPSKTEYVEGESFDPDGMTVTVTYADGRTETVADYTVEGGTELKAGTNYVTLTYTVAGRTLRTTVRVTVSASSQPKPLPPVVEPESEPSAVAFAIVIGAAALVAVAVILIGFFTDRAKRK